MPAPPITASTVYPRNNATVDTGGAVDIRNLDDTNSGTAATQTASITNGGSSVITQDHTFDPASGSVAASVSTLSRIGWAYELADFTPSDGRCKAYLPAQNVQVNILFDEAHTGTGAAANHSYTAQASLWRYNPSTNAGVFIASGGAAAQTWLATTAGSNANLAAQCSISAPATTFEIGETLLVQIGGQLVCQPRLLTGSTSLTITLKVDNNTTNVIYTGTTLRNRCFTSDTATAVGVPDSFLIRVRKTISSTAVGVASKALLVVSAARSVIAVGVPSSSRRARKDDTATAVGVPSRVSIGVGKTVTAVAVGVTAKTLRVRKAYAAVGVGVAAFTRLWRAFREDTATAVGEPSFTKFQTLTREFEVEAVGSVTGRIELPIDDLPDPGGGGTTVVRRYVRVFDE